MLRSVVSAVLAFVWLGPQASIAQSWSLQSTAYLQSASQGTPGAQAAHSLEGDWNGTK